MKNLICIFMLVTLFSLTSLSAFAQTKESMSSDEENHIIICEDGEKMIFEASGTFLPQGCDLLFDDWVFIFDGQNEKDQKNCAIDGENTVSGETKQFQVAGDTMITLLPYGLEASQCSAGGVIITKP
ncbi:MAG: hypothetical protein HQM14_10655 [SAR324 cluster bacterium]|nr:hypothetical protein [SAR324 cluster bacterium]